MALRKILEDGDKALRTICKPQLKFDIRLHKLLDDMAQTMYDANGVGLAAPQIGIVRRIFVVDVGDETGIKEFINPEIINKDGCNLGPEGCLSVPGKMGLVNRPMNIVVKAQNRNGKFFELEAEGFLARAICHENDHLNGVLYTDIMDKEITQEDLEKMQNRKVYKRPTEEVNEQE